MFLHLCHRPINYSSIYLITKEKKESKKRKYPPRIKGKETDFQSPVPIGVCKKKVLLTDLITLNFPNKESKVFMDSAPQQ